jgi:hypothetical protein
MKPYHAPSREIGALFVLFSIAGQAIESEHTGRDEVMRLEEVEILLYPVR